MNTKTISISRIIVISYEVNWGIPFWVSRKVNWNWENHMIRIHQWWESQCRANSNVSRKKWILKSRTVRVTVRDLTRKVNYLSKVIWVRKIIAELIRSINSTWIGKINILADGLIKRTSSMLYEIASKIVHKDEECDRCRKKK